MPLNKFKNQLKSANVFAPVDTLGSFDFYNNLICLDSVDYQTFENMRNNYGAKISSLEKGERIDSGLYYDLEKIVPLAVHEYTHFIDCTSTLWGLNHLSLMNSSFETCIEQREINFHYAKKFYDHIRTLRLPDYYTFKYEGDGSSRPWQWRASIGKLFSSDGQLTDRAVVFMRFSNSNGDDLVRSPLSMVSLLEATAMKHEIFSKLELLNHCDDEFRLVELASYKRSILDYLYNKEITEYSACVHCVANIHSIKDVIEAFSITSAIVRLCLNMPKSLFGRIAESSSAYEAIEISGNEELVELFKASLNVFDRGILFYIIVHALPKSQEYTQASLESALKKTLEVFGITYAEYEENGNVEALTTAYFKDGKFHSLNLMAQAGFNNYALLNRFGFNTNYEKVELPEVYLGDCTSIRLLGCKDLPLNELTADDIFDELSIGNEWVKRFAEACL